MMGWGVENENTALFTSYRSDNPFHAVEENVQLIVSDIANSSNNIHCNLTYA